MDHTYLNPNYYITVLTATSPPNFSFPPFTVSPKFYSLIKFLHCLWYLNHRKPPPRHLVQCHFQMADPDSDVPDYDIPITNLDEMLIPEGSLGFEYEGLNDQPIGENIMFNEDMNQFGHDQPIGENIVSNVDRNQLGHDHPIDENRMSDENMNQFGQSTSQAGTSHVNDQFNAQIPGMLNPEISGGENPILVAEWPVPEKPYACSCCQVIREIIHTIGMHMYNYLRNFVQFISRFMFCFTIFQRENPGSLRFMEDLV